MLREQVGEVVLAEPSLTLAGDALVRRTSTKLADGRELLYFDSDETAATTDRNGIVDPRDLEPTATSSEIRHDAVLDEWVAIASHRQGRTHLPPADECPLCPSVDGRHTEVPASDYDVVVFENRFPSFAEDADPGFEEDDERRAGRGRCEVVCFTSDHDAAMSQLPPERVRLVLDAWVDRSRGARAAALAWRRSSASRTAARRSGSPSATRTARSTATRS